MSDHSISIEQIAAMLAEAGFGSVPVSELEEAAIANALRECGGNRTHAAHKLGMSVRTLQRKLKLQGQELPHEPSYGDG
jgi:DNA-binding NtrC family response regulator